MFRKLHNKYVLFVNGIRLGRFPTLCEARRYVQKHYQIQWRTLESLAIGKELWFSGFRFEVIRNRESEENRNGFTQFDN